MLQEREGGDLGMVTHNTCWTGSAGTTDRLGLGEWGKEESGVTPAFGLELLGSKAIYGAEEGWGTGWLGRGVTHSSALKKQSKVFARTPHGENACCFCFLH